MGFKITGSVFRNCGTVVSTSHDYQGAFELDQCDFDNVNKIVEVRDPAGLYAQLGLPSDMPPEHFRQALQILAASRGLPLEQRVEQLRGSKLESLLSVGANLTTIVGSILSALPALS